MTNKFIRWNPTSTTLRRKFTLVVSDDKMKVVYIGGIGNLAPRGLVLLALTTTNIMSDVVSDGVHSCPCQVYHPRVELSGVHEVPVDVITRIRLELILSRRSHVYADGSDRRSFSCFVYAAKRDILP